MHKRLFPLMTLLCLVAVPTPARPADAESSNPTIVVRVQSIEALMADAKYLAELAGQREQAKQFDQMVKGLLQAKRLDGLDIKRPLYVYGAISANGFDSSAVALIPITDEKAVLDTLARFNFPAKKDDDGVYTVKLPNAPVDAYFRFANKYAYVTARDKTTIDKDKLLPPAKLLAEGQGGTIFALVRLDQVPPAVKEIAINQMELKLSEAEEQKPAGETELQHQFKVQAIKTVAKQITGVINDGGDLTVRVDVDRKANDLAVEAALAGKPGTKLAASIAEMGRSKSLFAGLSGKDAASSLLVHAALPEDLRKALEPVIDEGIRTALEKEKDEAKRTEGAKLLKALTPSFKSGDLDLAVRLLGPDKDEHFSVVAAVKLKEGDEFDKAVRNLVKILPEADKAKIALDAETAGEVKIHRIDAQKDYDEKARQLFGQSPAYMAIRDDAFLLAAGPEGLSALKDVLAAKPQPAPHLQLDVSVTRLILAMAVDKNNHDVQEAAKVVRQQLRSEPKGNDTIHVSVEGGKALQLHFTMKADAVKLLALLANKAKGGFGRVGERTDSPQEK
jgi:hypothetical protein